MRLSLKAHISYWGALINPVVNSTIITFKVNVFKMNVSLINSWMILGTVVIAF